MLSLVHVLTVFWGLSASQEWQSRNLCWKRLFLYRICKSCHMLCASEQFLGEMVLKLLSSCLWEGVVKSVIDVCSNGSFVCPLWRSMHQVKLNFSSLDYGPLWATKTWWIHPLQTQTSTITGIWKGRGNWIPIVMMIIVHWYMTYCTSINCILWNCIVFHA